MASVQDPVVTSRPRELWIDNLRVLVVAGVIVVHTATGYITGIADWYYDELTTSTVWSTVLAFPAVAGGLFGLGPLFLLAGWLSPASLARRGPGGYARTRVVRLGLPLIGFGWSCSHWPTTWAVAGRACPRASLTRCGAPSSA